jgi:hypothetical protein
VEPTLRFQEAGIYREGPSVAPKRSYEVVVACVLESDEKDAGYPTKRRSLDSSTNRNIVPSNQWRLPGNMQ